MGLVRNAAAGLVTAASALLGGCGTAVPADPAPSASAADTAALAALWKSEPTAAFLAMAPAINAAVGPAAAVPGLAAVSPALYRDAAGGTHAAAEEHVLTVRRLLAGPVGSPRSPVLLPTERLGTTWVWNIRGHRYVKSSAPAPDDRIRFLLYAGSDDPTERSEPIGHVDLVERSSGATDAVQVLVVAAGITWLDYRFSATPTGTGGRVDVLGSVTDGTERLDFDLRNVVTAEAAGLSLASDSQLELADRDVEFHSSVLVRVHDGALTVSASGDQAAVRHALEIWSHGHAVIDALARPLGGFFAQST
jgi:hypothetical protein